MFAELYFLLSSRAFSPRHVAPKNAAPCALAIRAAAVAHGATLEDALLEATWAAGESACTPRALSDDGQDCGLLQERGPMQRGHTCEELRADPVLSARVWLEDLDDLREKCGSTRAALGALATGKCGGAPRLVSYRLALAGLE